ncbi:MAG: class I SAM-dependent methyltransferase [Clostridiales bacterium]|uniref:class I SAM-dependent DNA methyltransferase n=1 Tax=Clostridium sp. N3C TaxID=1776758 RepID=UPI00092DF4C3|nr:class I SAM-dependent methyltransferase [Clostridium sp. N3C]NLZ48956.1 class I SAM-dependent methyltransferase [Clostridiales bacterium]SCN21442.1 dTDP-3-amino-3,4, 6-trideoxy-alpha-D-glucopyranose [Clostridium sp. N3C]
MHAYNKFAEIYDSLIYEDIDYVAWSNFILDKYNNFSNKKDDYLDLGCGTGNLAINIAPFFNNNWCVDLSEDMLIIAENKFRNKKQRAKFVKQDMKELNLNRKFDLITCSLDCTNYLTEEGELQKFFICIRNHLKEQGMFVFDINSDYKLKNILGNNTFTYNEEDIVYIWENTLEDNILEMYLTFFIKEDDLYERFDEVHVERIYSEVEIDEALKGAGLSIINKLDNYTDSSVSATTERITYFIRRNIQ